MSIKRPEQRKKRSRTEWIFGIHSAESRIHHLPESIIEAYFDENRRDVRLKKLQDGLTANNISFQRVSKRALANMVDANHQGIILKAKIAVQKPEKALYSLLDKLDHSPFLLVLDQITDPHNLGACLRTADGVGVDAVILPKDGACPINETVRRVASGAAETVEVFYVTNLVRCLQEIKKRGVWVIGLADRVSDSILHGDIQPPVAVVLGAEGKGMRRLTQEQCDQLVSIPMLGKVASLNVSVATGIVLYSVRRNQN